MHRLCFFEASFGRSKMTDLLEIPGIGKTFVKDFARINIYSIDDMVGKDPEKVYEKLCKENNNENHETSKNYLYVIRMAVYYADGGRKSEKLRWSAWKD